MEKGTKRKKIATGKSMTAQVVKTIRERWRGLKISAIQNNTRRDGGGVVAFEVIGPPPQWRSTKEATNAGNN